MKFIYAFQKSEVIHSLLGKSGDCAKNVILCKILIQHFSSWKQKSHPIPVKFG